MSLTLAQASTIVDAALGKARDTSSAPLTVAVLDSGGHLVALKREDRSGILRPDIATMAGWYRSRAASWSRTAARCSARSASRATRRTATSAARSPASKRRD